MPIVATSLQEKRGRKRGVTLASRRIRQCTHRLVLGNINIGKRGHLLTSDILVVNTNKLNSPITLCLTTTKINHVKLISNSVISLDGLRHRVVRAATQIGRPGIRSTTTTVHRLGPSIAISACCRLISTGGVTNLVRTCSLIVRTASGFTTGFLVGSTYMLTGGPCVRTNIIKFTNRIVAIVPNRNPYCHYVFHSVPTTNRVPAYGRTNILNTIINIVNDLRTARTIGLVINIKRPLINHVLAISTLAVGVQQIPLPRRIPSYPIYNRRPAVATVSSTGCVRPTYAV